MTTNIAEAGGFARTDPALPAPDIQWYVLPGPYADGGLADPASRALSVLVTLVSTGSRGRIRLRSNDPRHKPAIDPAYLSDSSDLDPLISGIGMAREFAAARPLRKVLKSDLAPGGSVRTETDLREWVRANLGTACHPAGTCAMGGDSRLAASKLASVVDTELRVRGVQGLRIVDASVMPTVPRGDTNAPTIAIAERAADLIQGRAPLAAVDPADMALAASA
jgi:choline dehydrogenase